ncbi:helix-turn-helix transcriptional regulator [Bradyrhizobium liaoningense]
MTDTNHIIWGAKDIAKAIGRSEKSVFAMLERGQCPGAKKIGGRWALNMRVFLETFGQNS